jgi:hypothetical protein
MCGALERVSYHWKCIHGSLLTHRGLDLRRALTWPPVADHHLQQSGGDRHIRPPCRHSRHGPLLPPRTPVHCVFDRRELCPVDHGVSLLFIL